MKFNTKLLSTALLAAAFAQPALAQEQGASAPQQREAIQITQEHIEHYADARLAVDAIASQWRDKVQDLTPEQQAELSEELSSAVTDSGISVEIYNAISAALPENEQLQQRIIQAMQEG